MDSTEKMNVDCNPVEIYTLGQFVVRKGKKTLSQNASRSYRLWDLYKYLLSHRGKGILPESIVEILWPDQNYSDPRGALRTPIYRLRQIFSDNPGEKRLISFSHGCYSWNTDAAYWLDVEEFESLCIRGRECRRDDPGVALEFFRKAIMLYKGEYLPECSYQDWVLPLRNYYRRLYLESVLELTDLLWGIGNYQEMLKICEAAILLEPLEETLHVRFLKALLKENKIKQASSHYQYVTALLYKEMGIKPSAAMREVFHHIQNLLNGMDTDSFHFEELSDWHQEEDGAFLCPPTVFNILYQLERRRSERSGEPTLLVVVTVTQAPTLGKSMKRLHTVLRLQLRKGDVFCLWSEGQYILMLPGLNRRQVEMVIARIKKACRKTPGFESILLQCEVQLEGLQVRGGNIIDRR